MYMYMYKISMYKISIEASAHTHTAHAMQMHIHVTYVHERSVIETRQSKATTPEDNSFFPKRKRRAASGGTPTRDVLHTRQTLYQLSHRGSSARQAESLNVMQRQSRLSLINRVTLSQYMYMYMVVHTLYMYLVHAPLTWVGVVLQLRTHSEMCLYVLASRGSISRTKVWGGEGGLMNYA